MFFYLLSYFNYIKLSYTFCEYDAQLFSNFPLVFLNLLSWLIHFLLLILYNKWFEPECNM